MKYVKFLSLLLLLPLGFFLSGCSGKPTEMIQLTEQTRKQATDEHADQFAVDDWNLAEAAWQQATAKLDEQNWGEASTLLLKAKTYYQKARDLAKGRHEAAVKEITSARDTALLRLKSLKEDAAAKKLSVSRQKEFDDQVKLIEENIGKIAAQLDNGQFNDANYIAQKSQRDVWELRQAFLK